MSNLKNVGGIYVISCPVCGKEKALSYDVNVKKYCYQQHLIGRDIFYCSYTCFRAAQKEKAERKAAAQRARLQRLAAKQRKQYEYSEARLNAIEATRQHNIFHFGKIFWEDWKKGLMKIEIAAKYSKSISFVNKYMKLYREATV